MNPDNEVYTEKYAEDQNVFTFASSLGFSAVALVQEDTIETEESIIPFISDITKEKVLHVPRLFRSYHYIPGVDQALAEIRFNKADRKVKYERHYNKIDKYLAYVGGLIGTLIGLMFILRKYNEKAY
jgi:hypothetical protein